MVLCGLERSTLFQFTNQYYIVERELVHKNKGGSSLQNKKHNLNKIANREALIGVGLVIFNFIWWYGFAYGLGSKDPDEYRIIFGLPDWFFYSCVVGFIVMVVLVIIVVKAFFVEIPFDYEDEEGEAER